MDASPIRLKEKRTERRREKRARAALSAASGIEQRRQQPLNAKSHTLSSFSKGDTKRGKGGKSVKEEKRERGAHWVSEWSIEAVWPLAVGEGGQGQNPAAAHNQLHHSTKRWCGRC